MILLAVNYYNFLLFLLIKDHLNIDSGKQKELLDLIDFSKLSESTLELCKESDHIPPQFVTQAALVLCTKLRKELDDAKTILKSYELKSIPSYKDTLETSRHLSCRLRHF